MAAVATLPPSQVMMHRAQRAFFGVQDFGDVHVTQNFETFMQVYQPILAKSMGLPVTQNVTLNVRLNPNCSAHTRLLVNAGTPGWYESLCSDLGVTALTTRTGTPLKELSISALYGVDSIFAKYAKPLEVPADLRFKPLEAPIQYTVNRHDIGKEWYEKALYAMAYAIGDTIHTNVPSMVSNENLRATPDDIAWQYVTSLVNNKKAMQQLFAQTLASLEPPIGKDLELTATVRNELMGHVYQSFVHALTKNEANIRYAFLKDSIPMISQHITSLMEAHLANPVAIAVAVAEVAAATPSIVNVDLFSDEVAVIGSSALEQLPLLQQTSSAALTIESWASVKRKAKDKVSSLKGKVSKKYKGAQVKSAEKKLEKAEIKKKFAGEKADTKSKIMKEKAERKAERKAAKAKESLTKKQQRLEETRKREQQKLLERKTAKKSGAAATAVYRSPREEEEYQARVKDLQEKARKAQEKTELALLKKNPPSDAPPALPTKEESSIVMNEVHPLGTFIGNLILAEIDPGQSTLMMTKIACGLCKRKTTTTTTSTRIVKKEKEESKPCCPRCQRHECGGCDDAEDEESSVTLLVVTPPPTQEQEKPSEAKKPSESSSSSSSPSSKKEAPASSSGNKNNQPSASAQEPAKKQSSSSISSTIPSMPTMTAVQMVLNSAANVSEQVVAAAMPTNPNAISKRDCLNMYASTHGLAMNYIMALESTYLTGGEYYIYSDKKLGSNTSLAGVKASMMMAPVVKFANPVKRTIQLQEFGANCVFHILN